MESPFPFYISLPFVGGIGLGALLPDAAAVHLSTACLPLLGVCAWTLLRKRRSAGAMMIMYFVAGLFCHSCASLTTSEALPLFENLRASGLSLLDSAVEGAGFVGENTRELLLALLCGQKRALPWSIRANFTKSGASHLLALSGLHLGIIASVVRKIFAIFGRSRPAFALRSALLVSLCGVYTFVCGASPSLVRALLFITIREIRSFCPDRRGDQADTLFISATVQLAFDPLAIESLAFQLSYLAMLGLVLLSPRLESWYPEGKSLVMRKIWKTICASVSCQAMTAPLVLLYFGNLPQYFLLTNLIAMPLCELLLPVAIAALIFPHPWLIKTTDTLADALLRVLEIIASM